MKNRKLGFSLLAGLSCFLVFPAISLARLRDAHLNGTLTDPSGAGVAGALVTAQREDVTAAKAQSLVFGPDGSYSLTLAAGGYRIVVTKASFLRRGEDITLQPGETLTLNFRLELAPMSASVLVTGQIAPWI